MRASRKVNGKSGQAAGRMKVNMAAAAAGTVFGFLTCASAPASKSDPQIQPAAAACAGQCGQIAALCTRNCALERDGCLARERGEARWDYEKYVIAQQRENRAIEKSLDDFDRDYRCLRSDVTRCEAACESDGAACRANCDK